MHTSIRHMNYAVDLKEQIQEADARAYLEMINERNSHRNQNRFNELVAELEAIDPDFDAWYDDDKNIPQYICWSKCKYVLDGIEKRIAFVHESILTRNSGSVISPQAQ